MPLALGIRKKSGESVRETALHSTHRNHVHTRTSAKAVERELVCRLPNAHKRAKRRDEGKSSPTRGPETLKRTAASLASRHRQRESPAHLARNVEDAAQVVHAHELLLLRLEKEPTLGGRTFENFKSRNPKY